MRRISRAKNLLLDNKKYSTLEVKKIVLIDSKCDFIAVINVQLIFNAEQSCTAVTSFYYKILHSGIISKC